MEAQRIERSYPSTECKGPELERTNSCQKAKTLASTSRCQGTCPASSMACRLAVVAEQEEEAPGMLHAAEEKPEPFLSRLKGTHVACRS